MDDVPLERERTFHWKRNATTFASLKEVIAGTAGNSDYNLMRVERSEA